jgi:hypothetical protein
MSFDWQTIAVFIIVALAALYVARRGLARLRSFTSKGGAACETGCGKCGDEVTPARSANAPVQISRARTAPTRRKSA